MNDTNLRVGLDIDDTMFDFMGAYVKKFGKPKSDSEITYNVQNKLRIDKEFWVNLELINKPDFTPELYCTKRVNPKSWTKECLVKNGLYETNKIGGHILLPPIYQMYYQQGNKANMIKGKVDVFVEDSIRNFIQLNLAGIPCLLIDCEHNIEWGPIGRVYSLCYEEIEDTYYLLKNTIGDNFKQLL